MCVNGSDHHGTNCTASHIPDGAYVCTCGYSSPPKPCGASVGREPISAMAKWVECRRGFSALTLHLSLARTQTLPPGASKWDCWKGNSAKKMGGEWYSTTKGRHPIPNPTLSLTLILTVPKP